jgi:hypothetical protein
VAYESSDDEAKDAFMEEERIRKNLRREWIQKEPIFRTERERWDPTPTASVWMPVHRQLF